MTERRQQSTDELLISLHNKIENLEARVPEKNGWSQNLNTVFGGILTAAVIALFTFTYSSNASTVALQTKIEFITNQITTLTTKIESMQSNYVTKSDFNALDARVRVIEDGTASNYTLRARR